MEFVKVAETTTFSASKMMRVTAGGKEILLVNVDGACYVIANKCTHLGGSLVGGVLNGNVVTCPRHGGSFDVKTGQAVSGAKIGILKFNIKNEVKYEVKVEGTNILIGIP
jgi:3-phenylpropionate/trans-cinnamate dioxygenase ferredoxin subunit